MIYHNLSIRKLIDNQIDDEFTEYLKQNHIDNEKTYTEKELQYMIKFNEQLNNSYLLIHFEFERYTQYTDIILYVIKLFIAYAFNTSHPEIMFYTVRSMDLLQKVLLNENNDNVDNCLNILNKNKHIYDMVCQGYNYYKYPEEIKFNNDDKEKIIITMTTCKRLELFIRTVQSFVVCCKDLHLVSKWICIDDNSDEYDRKCMKQMFPWMEFIFKTPEQKGHAISMQMLKDKINEYNPKYILHLEDDWLFKTKYEYITHCKNVLSSNEKYGQCLFNLNYLENCSNLIKGGHYKHTNNNFYYVEHEYLLPSDKNKPCSYWAHFSLRPGLWKKEILNDITFNKDSGHFELDSAYEYISNGWITTFFPTIVCEHIGRLTSNINENNAYTLNDQIQFQKNDSELIYTKCSFDNYKSILKRSQRLREKNLFICDLDPELSYSKQLFTYASHIFSTLIYLKWDIIILCKGMYFKIFKYSKHFDLSLNKNSENCLYGFIVNTKNLDCILSMDNILDINSLENKNIYISTFN